MQNFSILQLLKTLSAASTSEQETAKSPAAQPAATEPPTKSAAPKPAESENPPTHAREEEENAAYAYENFLSRHDQAVRRVHSRTEK